MKPTRMRRSFNVSSESLLVHQQDITWLIIFFILASCVGLRRHDWYAPVIHIAVLLLRLGLYALQISQPLYSPFSMLNETIKL